MKRPDAENLSALSVRALIVMAVASWLAFSGLIALMVAGRFRTDRMLEICAGIGGRCGDVALTVWSYLATGPGLLAALGGGLTLFALIRALLVARSTELSATGFLPESLPDELREAIESLNPALPVDVVDDERPIAYTAGIIKPGIRLSTGLIDGLSAEELKAVVAHEAAHIERQDNLYIFLAMVARDFLAILPISHYLFRLFYREKELAADAVAAKRTGDPVSLAAAIVSVSRLSTAGYDPAPAYSTFFPRQETVQVRVERLVGEESRMRGGWRRLGLALIASLIVIGSLAAAAWALPERPSLGDAACASGISKCTSTGSADCCKKAPAAGNAGAGQAGVLSTSSTGKRTGR